MTTTAAQPTLEQWPLERFKAYERNSRTHDQAQLEQIAASLLEFGWGPPILVRGETEEIAAGHGRLAAARLLVDRGHQEFATAPALVRHGWTDEQFRLYVIADNKIAANAGWDEELLALELGELQAEGYDLAVTGFSAEELGDIFGVGNPGKTDPEQAPPLPETPATIEGDVWILGGHRIICGDSTDPQVVAAVLDGDEPHLMVTDPPYGVNYDPNWRVEAGVGGGNTATGVVLNDDRADWSEAWALFPGSTAYVWHGGLHAGTVMNSLIDSGFALRAQIIWVKSRFALSRGHYHWQHEPAWLVQRPGQVNVQEAVAALEGTADEIKAALQRLVEELTGELEQDHAVAAYAVRSGETAGWEGDRKQSTVWMIEHLKSDTGHGTQKPIDCMRKPMLNNSMPGDTIYEPFSGSGTTIIAGEMCGRRVRAIELNPAYVDVAVKRWQDFTGWEATLEGDGRTFAEISKERLKPKRKAKAKA